MRGATATLLVLLGLGLAALAAVSLTVDRSARERNVAAIVGDIALHSADGRASIVRITTSGVRRAFDDAGVRPPAGYEDVTRRAVERTLDGIQPGQLQVMVDRIEPQLRGTGERDVVVDLDPIRPQLRAAFAAEAPDFAPVIEQRLAAPVTVRVDGYGSRGVGDLSDAPGRVTRFGVPAAIGAAVLFLLALLVARGRAATAIGTGLGLALVAAVPYVLRRFLPRSLEHAFGADFAGEIGRGLGDTLTTEWQSVTTVIGGTAAVLVAFGLLFRRPSAGVPTTLRR